MMFFKIFFIYFAAVHINRVSFAKTIHTLYITIYSTPNKTDF